MSVFLYALRGDTRPGYISGGGEGGGGAGSLLFREGFAGMGPRGSGCFRDLGAWSLGLEDRFPAVGFRCACIYVCIYMYVYICMYIYMRCIDIDAAQIQDTDRET